MPRRANFVRLTAPDRGSVESAPSATGKCHRRITPAALEGPEDGPRANARFRGQSFNRNRILPMGLDEFLQPPDQPRGGQAFRRFQQMAEAVTARKEKSDLQGLLELLAHRRRQYRGRGVQLLPVQEVCCGFRHQCLLEDLPEDAIRRARCGRVGGQADSAPDACYVHTRPKRVRLDAAPRYTAAA
jgi:hypothetical protein